MNNDRQGGELAPGPARGIPTLVVEEVPCPTSVARARLHDLVGDWPGRTAAWFRAPDGREAALFGAAAVVDVHPGGDLGDLAVRVGTLEGRLSVKGGVGPFLLGGFGFSGGPSAGPWTGAPAGRFVLGQVLAARGTDGGIRLAVVRTGRVGPSRALARLESAAAAPAPRAPHFRMARGPSGRAEFRASVDGALARIGSSDLEKVVLARSVMLRAAGRPVGPAAAASALSALERDYPTCFHFLLRGIAGPGAFFGASPERLVRARSGRIEVAALAGSAPRAPTPDGDSARAAALLCSAKDRREHILVVREIYAALRPLCARMEGGPTRILALRNILHLYTPVHADLRAGLGILDAALALHPTPAVGGTPREAALGYIERVESRARGWYAGAVGMLEPGGQGDLAVALRSAIVRGGRACAFAGAGIVAGSDPDLEWEETELKLRPVVEALGAGEARIPAGTTAWSTPAA